ncbi:MAG: hypothetical protein JWP44_5104 [Mucilaginibacter sp.]|nr:hypothetical protein [Mucilaginibacter sp.]
MFFEYCNVGGIVAAAEFLISIGLGVCALSLALHLKKRRFLRGRWYSSLRHLLTALAIAGLSNAWTVVLVGHSDVKATELLLNLSLISLIGWVWAFYRYNLFKQEGPCSLEKILKFLHSEVVDNRSLSARTKRL